MIENLKSQEELEVKKLKVTKADIVVRGDVDLPYYVIVYHEVGKDYDNEGFGSYCLGNVFKWREEELEIVDVDEQPKTDWIPVEERLPSEGTEVLVTIEEIDDCRYTQTSWLQDGQWVVKKTPFNPTVIAWQPKPQPYKKEGAENE